MDQADSKVGAYPNADQPNQFGTFYRDYFVEWQRNGTRKACLPHYLGALGICRANADDLFLQSIAARAATYLEMDLTEATIEISLTNVDSTLTQLELTDMHLVMWDCWALATRLRWFTWRQPKHFKETMPVAITPTQ